MKRNIGDGEIAQLAALFQLLKLGRGRVVVVEFQVLVVATDDVGKF